MIAKKLMTRTFLIGSILPSCSLRRSWWDAATTSGSGRAEIPLGPPRRRRSQLENIPVNTAPVVKMPAKAAAPAVRRPCIKII